MVTGVRRVLSDLVAHVAGVEKLFAFLLHYLHSLFGTTYGESKRYKPTSLVFEKPIRRGFYREKTVHRTVGNDKYFLQRQN